MVFDLWTWMRLTALDIGGEPSPPGPPPRLVPDIGSHPPPEGPPPR